MRSTRLIPVAVLALAVACSENSSNPVETNRPQFAQGGNPGNPKYSKSDYSVSANGFTLSHSFKQTGLGSFSTVDYDFTAQFNATVTCINPGTNQVFGQPFNFSVDATSNTTEEPKSGQVTATKTLTANPQADCGNPPHQPRFSNVSWTEIKFCWGQTNLTQGPVPEEPGDGSFAMSAGETATGSPLSGGSATQAVGIFATPCLAGEGA